MTPPVAALSDYKMAGEAKVIKLTTFFPHPPHIPMAEQFFDILSTRHNVGLFSETVYRLYERSYSGLPRPQEYWIHEISIVKRYLFIQHEALIVEIRHIPAPDSTMKPERSFFILVDRTIFGSSMSSGTSNDRIICSHATPEPYWSTTIWRLRPTVLGQNIQMNMVQLACVLRSVSDYTPHYNAFQENCFWFVYSTTRIIRLILANDNEIAILEQAESWRNVLFQRGKMFLFRIGAATPQDITAIQLRYNESFAALWPAPIAL
ncbi:hypothetical protein F5887DRAFT_1072941 [Amanita rubescens]|nr:hypothetical protein F5887DRAFT_1072941 [Amanita rubescens]